MRAWELHIILLLWRCSHSWTGPLPITHYVVTCLRLLFFPCWRLSFPTLACMLSALPLLMAVGKNISALQISLSTSVLAFTCTWIATFCFSMFCCSTVLKLFLFWMRYTNVRNKYFFLICFDCGGYIWII